MLEIFARIDDFFNKLSDFNNLDEITYRGYVLDNHTPTNFDKLVEEVTILVFEYVMKHISINDRKIFFQYLYKQIKRKDKEKNAILIDYDRLLEDYLLMRERIMNEEYEGEEREIIFWEHTDVKDDFDAEVKRIRGYNRFYTNQLYNRVVEIAEESFDVKIDDAINEPFSKSDADFTPETGLSNNQILDKNEKDKLSNRQQVLLLHMLGVFESQSVQKLNEIQKGKLFGHLLNRDEKNTENYIRYRGYKNPPQKYSLHSNVIRSKVQELCKELGLESIETL